MFGGYCLSSHLSPTKRTRVTAQHVQIERVVDQRARLANVDGGLHLVAGEHPHLDAGATQARDGLVGDADGGWSKKRRNNENFVMSMCN